MKKLILVILSLHCLACSSLATEPGDAPVVSLGTEEILADSSVLKGLRRVSTGQPDKDVLLLARDAGFVAIVDLRAVTEDRGYDEATAVVELGMTYVSLPVTGADDVTFENAAKLDRILSGIDGPVLLHCSTGNRVGALIALRASQQGAAEEESLAAGKAAGLTRLEPVVVERLRGQD